LGGGDGGGEGCWIDGTEVAGRGEVVFEGAGGVDGVVVLGGVAAGEREDDFAAAGVGGEEGCYLGRVREERCRWDGQLRTS
jgi:hypothetical protein